MDDALLPAIMAQLQSATRSYCGLQAHLPQYSDAELRAGLEQLIRDRRVARLPLPKLSDRRGGHLYGLGEAS